MIRFIGTVLVLGLTFYAGYYVGQRSFGDVTRTLGGFSKELMDKTLGFERMLRLRQFVLDAKGLAVQARGDVIDRNYGSAAKSLGAAGEGIEKALGIEHSGEIAAKLKAARTSLLALQQELQSGKPISRDRLDAVEKQLNDVLGP
jgi:hypothetical protein